MKLLTIVLLICAAVATFGFDDSNLNEHEDKILSDFRPDNDYDQEDEPCQTVTKIIQPKKLMNLQKESKLINVGTITTIECLTPRKDCSRGSLPVNMTAFCKQHHVTINLKVLDEGGNEIGEDAFYYPSGCSCTLFRKKNT